MQPASLIVGGINVVQRVVGNVIAHVADKEEGPENGEADGITDRY